MTNETVDATAAAGTGRVASAIDSARRLAHEAELITSMVADTTETAADAARHAVTRGRRNIERVRDSVEYRMRRAPLVTIGAAVLIGLCARAVRKGVAPKQW